MPTSDRSNWRSSTPSISSDTAQSPTSLTEFQSIYTTAWAAARRERATAMPIRLESEEQEEQEQERVVIPSKEIITFEGAKTFLQMVGHGNYKLEKKARMFYNDKIGGFTVYYDVPGGKEVFRILRNDIYVVTYDSYSATHIWLVNKYTPANFSRSDSGLFVLLSDGTPYRPGIRINKHGRLASRLPA